MSERPNCHCPLCQIERKLRAELADSGNQENQRILLRSAPHLAHFHTTSDLLSHLRSLNGKASDPLLSELLHAKNVSLGSVADNVFVLLFLPVLHSTVRRVRKRYPALSREDVAQQALQALFEYLASTCLAARETYLAFAIARKVRRAAFQWRPAKPSLPWRRRAPTTPEKQTPPNPRKTLLSARPCCAISSAAPSNAEHSHQANSTSLSSSSWKAVRRTAYFRTLTASA